MMKRIPLLLLGTLLLSGCGTMADRLEAIGETPKMTPIQNPQLQQDYKPVSMPMPDNTVGDRQANSLWRSGSRAFFKDQRANKVGDLMTVLITIDDEAQLSNTSRRSRNNTDNIGVPNLFGLEAEIGDVLNDAATPGALVGTTGTSNDSGTGSVARSEKIDLQVAATIIQLLPNGNMVLRGSQEMRVNNEVRVLEISGIIRPEDITSANTITYEKVAEARISYGGRGQITDVQQPPYGNQLLDIISPF